MENESLKKIKDNEQNSLKDSFSISNFNNKYQSIFGTYNKLNKLITALYIVTDIMDKEEPVRLKLRTLGVDIISDSVFSSRTELISKTDMILSLLDIALAIRLVSEMNLSILKKEFKELRQTLEVEQNLNEINNTWLEDFLTRKENLLESNLNLDKKMDDNKNTTPSSPTLNTKIENSSFVIKQQRRDDIIKVIKDNGGSATITEVKNKASGALLGYSEKTLQRELVAMVKDSVLNKNGEKRWSRYFIK